MGVIQKKVGGANDKKKNKVKDNIKNKLEGPSKFPKGKNQEKPTDPKKGDKILKSKKKKFEKNVNKGSPPGISPKPKQQDGTKSPNKKKNKKNKNVLKSKPDDSKVENIPLTEDETKTAISVAKAVKNDNDGINELLTKILEKSDVGKEKIVETKTPVKGLQVLELISKDKLKQQVKSFMKIVKHRKAQSEYKSKLINDRRFLTLSILAMKIPECPNKNLKVKVPVPLYTVDNEICLFVADLERGRKRDDEPFVRHYEEILANNGVTCVNKVMTVSHLIKEYSTFELKYRLANTYDVFLVEGKVSNRVGTFLGQIFSKIKRNPIPIRDFTKETIESALNTVTYRQSGLGPVTVINFAYDTMPESEIIENLYSILQQLKIIYPGGWNNIKSLCLTAFKDLTFPIMYNYACPNDIPVVKVKNVADIKIAKAKSMLDGVLQNIEITGNGLIKKKPKQKFSENDVSSGNEDDEEQVEESKVESSPPKPKKKKRGYQESEAIIKTESDLEEVPTSKKEKNKKKKKTVATEEEETIVEIPEPVVKKQKKNKKNEMANFDEADSSLGTSAKLNKIAKFGKSSDGGKPKKKKGNKAN